MEARDQAVHTKVEQKTEKETQTKGRAQVKSHNPTSES